MNFRLAGLDGIRLDSLVLEFTVDVVVVVDGCDDTVEIVSFHSGLEPSGQDSAEDAIQNIHAYYWRGCQIKVK